MSANIDDGGPAFATATCGDWQIGMSLRDWLAGQALQGWLASYDPNTQHPATNPEYLNKTAQQAYLMADAMIAARKGTATHE